MIDSLLKILQNNKLTLKNSNIPENHDKKILAFITKTLNKNSSNNIVISKRSTNPVILSKKDLIIIIRKILKK